MAPTVYSSEASEGEKPAKRPRIRNHKGNIPILPQTKPCPMCDAKFTRTTHLKRHLRSHSNDRSFPCHLCNATFTRSDMLIRHIRSCSDPNSGSTRRKSCENCSRAKVKCDQQQPQCSSCLKRNKDCVYVSGSQLKRKRNVPTIITPSSSQSPGRREGSVQLSPVTPMTLGWHSEEGKSCDSGDVALTPFFYPPASRNDALSLGLYDNYSGSQLPITVDRTTYENILLNYPDTTSLSSAAQIAPIPTDVYIEELVSVPFVPPLPSSSTLLNHQPTSEPLNICNHYYNYFFSHYAVDYPFLHESTWTMDRKSWILLRAMQACGAIYANHHGWQEVSEFVAGTMATLQNAILWEFSRTNDVVEKDQLILAAGLLLTIPLFHQMHVECTDTYHQLLIHMIHESHLVQRIACYRHETSWISNMDSLRSVWRTWAHYEATKRILLFAYTYDCRRAVTSSLRPSFHPRDMNVTLVCDFNLFSAPTPMEWQHTMFVPTVPESMGTGMSMQVALNAPAVPFTMDACSRKVLLQSMCLYLFVWRVSNRRVPELSPYSFENGQTTDTLVAGESPSENKVSQAFYQMRWSASIW